MYRQTIAAAKKTHAAPMKVHIRSISVCVGCIVLPKIRASTKQTVVRISRVAFMVVYFDSSMVIVNFIVLPTNYFGRHTHSIIGGLPTATVV